MSDTQKRFNRSLNQRVMLLLFGWVMAIIFAKAYDCVEPIGWLAVCASIPHLILIAKDYGNIHKPVQKTRSKAV